MKDVRPEDAEQHDLLMRDVVADAAAGILSAPSFLERFIDEALEAALISRRPSARVILRRQLPLADWERLPKSGSKRPATSREADLQFIAAGETAPSLLSEQKVWDFDASIFDLAKLLSFSKLPGVVSTYLIGADEPRRFALDKPGHRLYSDGPPRSWSLREVMTAGWESAWVKHCRRAGVAPSRLPMRFTTHLVARAAVPAFPGHELRCVRVEPDGAAPWGNLRQGRLLLESPPEIEPDAEDAMIREINERSHARFYERKDRRPDQKR